MCCTDKDFGLHLVIIAIPFQLDSNISYSEFIAHDDVYGMYGVPFRQALRVDPPL